jgi:hypothetical protein
MGFRTKGLQLPFATLGIVRLQDPKVHSDPHRPHQGSNINAKTGTPVRQLPLEKW